MGISAVWFEVIIFLSYCFVYALQIVKPLFFFNIAEVLALLVLCENVQINTG